VGRAGRSSVVSPDGHNLIVNCKLVLLLVKQFGRNSFGVDDPPVHIIVSSCGLFIVIGCIAERFYELNNC